MAYVIYYSSITEREGSWQRSEGYYLSGSKAKLKAKIESSPKDSADVSFEFGEISSFETTETKYARFCKDANEAVLWVDDFEIDKYK
ncbi:MAG: hypothetical protein ACOCWM_05365 [Cyclobacteriaceae bacterium]